MTSADPITQLNAALSGRYEIEREIGAGGMATVYLARDLRHGRKVALKVLREDLTASLGVARFLREIEIAAGLSHPHILPLHDSGEAAGRLFYVMPYVEGESLRDVLDSRGEMPMADAVRALRDVADAIAYAHKHGVVHRDIKPENVMIAGRHALVTDFGVAKAVRDATVGRDLTAVGMTLGTPAYMSPEQATADPNADYRSDIYSFGAVAYELIAGRPPFSGDTHQSVLAAQVITPPPPISMQREGIPPTLAALIMKCLEKNPADRWQSADELVPQLEALLTPSGGIIPSAAYPVPATTPGVRERGFFFARRMWVTAGALIVLLGLGAFAGWRRFHTVERPVGAGRVAVLPFENLGRRDDEYFVSGLADEITDHLATIPGLAVVARSSANKYRKTTKSVRQIGAELGVDYLLEGSVRWEKSPNGTSRVRVSPQLVRVSDEEQMWTESYDKVLASVFDVQSEVAEGVADALNIALGETVRRSMAARLTSNLDAYDAYLRGNEIFARMTFNDWDAQLAALKLYEKATTLDPGFAAAHARIARIHLILLITGYDLSVSHLPRQERVAKAKASAELAVRLRPDLAETHLALGKFYERNDDPRARDEYTIALRAEPSSVEALEALSGAQTSPQAALPYIQRAAKLDPRSAKLAASVADQQQAAHEFVEAARSYDRAITLAPDAPDYYLLKAAFELDVGNATKACETMRSGAANAGVRPMVVFAAKEPIFNFVLRICSRDYASALRSMKQDVFGTDTIDYLIVKADLFRNVTHEPLLAHAYFDSLRVLLQARQKAEDLRVWNMMLGWTYGGLGQREPALAEWRKFSKTARSAKLAETYLMLGMKNEALAWLEAGGGTRVRGAWVSADPLWAPLRGNPRFEKALAATTVLAK
jgi:serine/threonine protein kinase/tetratricopeptide (TPR) repeat protein